MPPVSFLPTSFLAWYFCDSGRVFFRLIKRTALLANQIFAFSLMFRLLRVPLYGDWTLVSRVLSFVFRLLRILLGLWGLLLFELLAVGLALSWYVLPFWTFGQEGIWGLFLWLAATLFLYVFLVYRRPRKALADLAAGESWQISANLATRKLLRLVEKEGGLAAWEECQKLPRVRNFRLRADLAAKDLEYFGLTLTSVKFSRDQFQKRLQQILKEINCPYLREEVVFLALLGLAANFEERLAKSNLSEKMLLETLAWIVDLEKRIKPHFFWSADFQFRPLGGANRGLLAGVTPVLSRYGENLTGLAGRGLLRQLVGKKELVRRASEVLGRKIKNNLLIVGEPGCGKTTFVGGIAAEIASGTGLPSIAFKEIHRIDVGSLTAGVKTGGEVNERLVQIFEEVGRYGNIILFIDDFHNVVTSLRDLPEESVVFATLESRLSSGRCQFIGATDWASYRKYIEPNQVFARLFEIIEVPEAAETETLEILKLEAVNWERERKVVITYPALVEAVKLSHRYVFDRVLPDKAVDVVDGVVGIIGGKDDPVLNADDIRAYVSEVTKITVTKVGEEEAKLLLNLETILHQRLVGQNEAVDLVADALRRSRSGMREEKLPIASFLFVGPTGVGKTETAKSLAHVYFGQEDDMIRLDMSEYQGEAGLIRFLGSAKDKIPGALSDRLARNPSTVLLLDELEKADPTVWQLLLQIFDEGTLTDNLGKKLNFSQVIIVATSNVGTDKIMKEFAGRGDYETMKKLTSEALQKTFSPELLNRFSGIVTFKPLTPEEVLAIARIKVKNLASALKRRGVILTVTDEALAILAEKGYEPQWGARPLNRVLTNEVESKLAKLKLEGKILKGEEFVIDKDFFTSV